MSTLTRRIGFRLTAGYLSIALLLFVTLGIAALAAAHVRDSFTYTVQTDDTLVGLVARHTKLEDDQETGLRGYLLTRQPVFLDPYRAARRALPGLRRQILALSASDRQGNADIRRMVDQAHAWEAWAHPYIVHPGLPRDQHQLVSGLRQGKLLFDRYRAAADAATRVLARDRDARLRQSQAALDQMDATLAIILLSSLILVGIVGWRSTHAVTGPLARLRGTAEAIGRGDLEHPIEESGTHEFALLAASMDRMRVDLDTQFRQRREAEEQLRAANVELERASRLKSEFLANMSHEIRTPMNGVIGMTSLLLDTPLTPEQQEYTETIRTSGEALLAIINDILDFSKIEAGRLNLEVIPVDVRRIVEEVVDLFGAQTRAKGLEMASLIYQEVPRLLQGDGGRLRQVLTNLVGNAVKFTERGEVVVRVSLAEATPDDVLLRVTVSDTGIGIAPDVIPYLFDSFTQADASTTRRFGGTGLGLSISKRLSELMGGAIGVESTPGRGSTFWCTVRLGRVAEQPAAQPAPAPRCSHLRVLIVDDNETNRKILQYQTAAWGMTNDSAAGAAEALALLRAGVMDGRPYDVALLDMHMPDMDGLELARAIKSDATLSAVRLVLLPSSSPERAEVEAAGVAACLTKPLRESQLYALLAEVTSDRAPQATPSAAPAQASAGDARLHTATRGRILVAEDNPVNSLVALRMLEKLGYRADTVANGKEALDALASIPYDLVLMDCHMPEMDGYTATGEIRRREEGSARRTPIVAMTANALPGDADACLAAGMDDYLAKPVSPVQLDAALRQWVAPRAAPVARPPVESVLDPKTLATLRGIGSGTLVAELSQLFLSDTPPRLQALREAVASGDAHGVMQAAHSLKGSCRTLGVRRMMELCGELEARGQAGHLGNAAGILDELLVENIRAMDEIRLLASDAGNVGDVGDEGAA